MLGFSLNEIQLPRTFPTGCVCVCSYWQG